MDKQNSNQTYSGADLRTTKVMLIGELLDILYSQDEIWVPEKDNQDLNLQDLVNIVQLNKHHSDEPEPAEPLPERALEQAGDLKSLIVCIKSGELLEVISSNLDRLFPDEPALQAQIQDAHTHLG